MGCRLLPPPHPAWRIRHRADLVDRHPLHSQQPDLRHRASPEAGRPPAPHHDRLLAAPAAGLHPLASNPDQRYQPEAARSQHLPLHPHPAGLHPACLHPACPHPACPHPACPHPACPHPADPRPADPRPADPRPADPHPADLHPADLHPACPHPACLHPACLHPAPPRLLPRPLAPTSHSPTSIHRGRMRILLSRTARHPRRCMPQVSEPTSLHPTSTAASPPKAYHSP